MSASITTSTSPNPWLRILDALEKKVNRHSYDTWLKPLRYSHTNGATLFVRVPAPEFREMGERYADLIREAIENLRLEVKDVEFVTAEDSPRGGHHGSPQRRVRYPGARPGATAGPFRFRQRSSTEPALHLRCVRCRQRQSVCPRRRHGGRRAAFQGLQPAVSLRRSGDGQDPSDAGHRARGKAAQPGSLDLLCLQREVHQ